MNAAREEFEMQKQLSHPHILEVKEMFVDELRNTLYTVMEFINGQEL
jgi:serine/threonine protein kinase